MSKKNLTSKPVTYEPVFKPKEHIYLIKIKSCCAFI